MADGCGHAFWRSHIRLIERTWSGAVLGAGLELSRRSGRWRVLAGLLLPVMCFAAQAQANRWTVCDYTVETTRAHPSEHQVAVTIIAHRKVNPPACPEPGERMSFAPETADYQSQLPRKRWPQERQRAHLRYRFMHGQCKDRGPCTIEHHSVLRVWSQGAAAVSPAVPLRDGDYLFSHRYAEQPTLAAPPLSVRISGRRVTVINRSDQSVFPLGVVESGTLHWHARAKSWIITNTPADRNAEEVGGCSDGPSVIDLVQRIYWSC